MRYLFAVFLPHGGLLLDDFFACCSAESTEVLQPLATDDRRYTEEPAAPHAKQAQARMNLVAPNVKQPTVVEPTAPTMEEPSTTGPTLPSSGLHDKGDPGVEKAWDAAKTSSGLARVGMESMGDAPSSVAQGPPEVVEQASSAAASIAGVALGRSV